MSHYVFDEILGRHMERLIGSRLGIGSLQLTVGTIACLTLLDEQPAQPTDGGTAVQENTLEVLHAKLGELGVKEREKAESLIQEMVSKEYILVDEQGKISAGKPALSMARLIERVFPKMQGKALIAYFVQTIDEVLTGRKSAEAAVTQFDQALRMQGVPLKSPKAETVPKGGPKEERKPEKSIKEILKTHSTRRSTGEERSGARIIGSEGMVFKVEAAPVSAVSAAPLEEKAPVAPESEPVQAPADHAAEASLPGAGNAQDPALSDRPGPSPQAKESPPIEATPSPAVPPPQETVESQKSGVQEESPTEEQSGIPAEAPPPSDAEMEEAPDEEVPAEDEDDLVEKEVAEFQDDLAATCPLCKTGKVRERQTGKGRVYYKCSNKSCNLVSWGKPYYLACPHCSNPFLVEVSATEEGVKLRCPRGTCNYRCTLPPGGVPTEAGSKPKRRLVRRRVVRRKK